MNDQPSREAILFGEAAALPASQRAAFLEGACAGDAELRRAIQALLDAHEDAGAFLETASAGGRLLASAANPMLAAAESAVPAQKAGDKIGRYKLLEQIGEGGCGVVFMAEQETPVRRRVALKILKLGMDTKSVIARFEAERQALAMMDHPNIAKVLDAGATETGRPYFVMELVRGVRITEYCDQLKLSTRERLDLFISVCQAVQHAHQKGIVHRDLKPSNILVTEHDGTPVPKIIDFGIAKAVTDQRLTDKTLFTAFQQFIGTPAYTSPEQAGLGGLDIDTRSDIYSLGVLLYELLTGRPPFSPAEFQRVAIDEMLRVIREKEPARPSARLTTLNERELTTVAQQRQVESAKLPALLRGDLDWIVMKCLEKDRSRRYETANGLVTDIRRHLNHEPVVARPPSTAYRFQKLVRRNKLTFVAGMSVAAALVIGLGVSTWMFLKERTAFRRAVGAERAATEALGRAVSAERAQSQLRLQAQTGEQKAEMAAARSDQIAQFLKDMLQRVGPSYALGRDTAMLREILDETAQRIGKDLTNRFEVQADLGNTVGTAYWNIGRNEEAEKMFRQSLAAATNAWPGDHPILADTLRKLSAVLHRTHGDPVEAAPLAQQALAMDRRLWGNKYPAVAASLVNWGRALVLDATQVSETDFAGEEVAEDNDGQINQARFVLSERVIREGLALNRELLGKEHSQVAVSFRALGQTLYLQEKLEEAESAYREALRIWEEVLHEEHRDLPWCLFDLARALKRKGDLLAAENVSRKGWVKRTRLLGPMDPDLPDAGVQLLSILENEGKWAEAEAVGRELMQLVSVHSGGKKEDGQMAQAAWLFAECLRKQKKDSEAREAYAEAERLYRDALDKRLAQQPKDLHSIAQQLNNLAVAIESQGRFAEAEPIYRDALAWYRRLHTNEHREIATALDNLAFNLREQHKFSEAEAWGSEAVAMWRKLHTNVHRSVANSLHSLGAVLSDQEKWVASETVVREELTMRRMLHTNANSSLALACDSLAFVLQEQRKFQNAEILYREALAMQQKLHTNAHRDVAHGLRRLGLVLRDQQNWIEAEVAFRDELKMRRSLQTYEHPKLASACENLASVLRKQRKYRDAEMLYREALAIQQKLQTNAHESIADDYRWLGRVLCDQKKWVEAEAAFRDELTMRRTLLREENQGELALSLDDFGNILALRGKLAEAEAALREAWDLKRKNEKTVPLAREDLQSKIASLLDRQKKYPQAETFHEGALALVRSRATNDPQKLELRLIELADCLSRQNKFAASERLYREALTNALLVASNHFVIELLVIEIASLLRKQERTGELEQFYRELVPGPLHDRAQAAGLLSGLGRALAIEGRWPEAVALFTGQLEADPTNINHYRFLAPLLVAAGERDTYNTFSQRMLDRFKGTTNAHVAATTAKACLILPWSGCGAEEFDALAQTALNPKLSPDIFIWSEFDNALVEYRRGRFANASRWAEKVLAKNPNSRLATATYALLAMAQARLKKTEQAVGTLSQAVKTSMKMPKLEASDFGVSWHDRIIAQTLLEEANAVMEGPATTTGAK